MSASTINQNIGELAVEAFRGAMKGKSISAAALITESKILAGLAAVKKPEALDGYVETMRARISEVHNESTIDRVALRSGLNAVMQSLGREL